MLAVQCPRCGASCAVSLAVPDRLQCRHCGHDGATPEEVQRDLRRAADHLAAVDVRARQLTSAQRGAFRTRALGCLHAGVVLIVGLPFAVVALATARVANEDVPGWMVAFTFLPLLLAVVFGVASLAIVRRERTRLQSVCAAIPPAVPGEPARCRICGAPVPPVGRSAIARCSFCAADNVVDPRVLKRVGDRQQVVIAQHEAAIRAQTGAVIRTSLKAKLAVVMLLVVAPVATVVAILVVGLLLMAVQRAADETQTYAWWTTANGECLGEVRTEGGKTRLTIGADPPLGVDRTVEVADPQMLRTLRTAELPGLVLMKDGLPARVVRVIRTAGSGRVNLVLAEQDGRELRFDPRGECRPPESPPRMLRRLGYVVKGLAADEESVFFADGGVVKRLTLRGEALADVHDFGYVYALTADQTHLYVSDGKRVQSVPKAGGAPVLVTNLPADARHMVVASGHVIVSTEAGVVRAALPSGPSATAAECKDVAGIATDGTSAFFGSKASGTILRAPVAGGPVQELAKGLSLPAAVPVHVAEQRVYFADAQRVIRTVPVDGGEVKEYARAPLLPQGLHAEGDAVLWWAETPIEERTGGIYRQKAGDTKVVNITPSAGSIEAWGAVIRPDGLVWIDARNRRLMTSGR